MFDPWKKNYDQPRQYIKKRDITLPAKVLIVKAMVFPVVMYGCESWTMPKNWCFWTVVLQKSSLNCKEIKSVHPKGDQSWIFIGRTDAEVEIPILWPPDVKNWPWKRPWCWERLKAGGEGDERRWDGWMASLTQWTWVWISSRSWWRAGRSGVLQSVGSQRVGRDRATELNRRPWTEAQVNKLAVNFQKAWDRVFHHSAKDNWSILAQWNWGAKET